jgi:hypothetical protein
MSTRAPASDEIIGELRAAGHLRADEKVELIALPGNPLRADHSSRLHFQLRENNLTTCYLTAGPNLTDLHRRTAEFADACPTLACRPLFLHRANGWDFIGTEFFDGESLETSLRSGQLTLARARELATNVLATLDRTTAPSSLESVQNELDALLPPILSLPVFGELDRVFLQAIVFPLIRTGAGAMSPQTRWTNGDFIARNVLVNPRGEVRLIDCELAERTHFFAADAWRWRTYSNVPEELRMFPPVGEIFADPWIEMLAILRQMVHQFEINGPAIATVESRAAIDRLIALTATAHSDFRGSAFFRALASNTLPSLARRAGIVAQLYWATDGEAFQEHRSQRHEYAPDEPTVVRFHLRNLSGRLQLRLDPSEAPGLLAISRIVVRSASTQTLLIERDTASGWKGIDIVSGLFPLPGALTLRMLSLDTDPHFVLPGIELGAKHTDVECEFHLRYCRDLTELPKALNAAH